MASRDDATEKSDGAVGSLLPTMTDQRPDAGTRHLNHYANKLPKWRHALRQSLIPLVRWETPYLALLQEKIRSPTLDSYFAFTANLGTHTFFMIMLPILFWCGYTSLGRAMVHMLAAGVFWSGFFKDMLCLPRPLSPPLQRITHSGSAALEYGFPSTHSTNAVSVAVYAIWALHTTADTRHPYLNTFAQALFYFYAASIVVGRLYCGMHGFTDVVVGSALGGAIAIAQILYGGFVDTWMCDGGYQHPLIATLIILILVRIHPEPADDCPCFDDSVAFAGVTIGAEIGVWHYSAGPYSLNEPTPGTVPFDLHTVGLPKAVLRIVLGVFIVFAWRGLMKPTLLKILPPIFRLIERIRLNMPRRFFLEASQYKSVPDLRKDDNVIPPASDLPRLFDALRHPRKRSISVGPQSAADAYETIAYRHKKRRESLSSERGANPISPLSTTIDEEVHRPESKNVASGTSTSRPLGADLLPSPAASRVHSYEQMMSTNDDALVSMTPPESDAEFPMLDTKLDIAVEEEKEAREIFLKLERPRVRYDVEVVTKLIVYSGIAWLSVEWNPVLFELCGLGVGL